MYPYPSQSTTADLLSVTLREGAGTALLSRFGSLHEIAAATLNDLRAAGMTERTAKKLLAILELGQRYVAEVQEERPQITAPRDVADLLGHEMTLLDREVFRVVVLNTKNSVLATPTVSVGILDTSLAHPREIFKPAIARSAAAVIACHNHPSGDPEPSSQDIELTKRLREAGEILGITFLDHIVLGHNRWVSLKERGVI